jgi:hypothetical protein
VPRDTRATWTRAYLDAACESITCALQKSLDKHAPKKPRPPILITGGTTNAQRKNHF